MANIILKEKIRNPQNEEIWITPFYVTDDNKIHINGFLETEGAVKTQNLQNNAITTEKIIDGAITANKIQNDAITNEKILSGAVQQNSLAVNSVSSEKIVEFAVKTSKIDNKAVETDKIADGAVTKNKIANRSISPEKLASDMGTIMNPLDPDGTGKYNGSYRLTFNY